MAVVQQAWILGVSTSAVDDLIDRKAIRPEAEPVTTNRYIALIHKDPESDYGVSFPDFPGCVTANADLDEARGMAEEALAFHIEGMTEDGATIPEPSSLEAVMSNPVNRDGVAILVAGPPPPARIVRVNITLPEDLLKDIDVYTRSQGFTRSGFLATAAWRAIGC